MGGRPAEQWPPRARDGLARAAVSSSPLGTDLDHGVGQAPLERLVVWISGRGVVVAGGPGHQGGLDDGVGVGGELGPQGTARIVEAHEAPGEPFGRVGLAHRARGAGQLLGLAHTPVHRGLGQRRVGRPGGDGRHRGEHVEGEASGRKGIKELGEPSQFLRRHHQGAGRGGAQAATVAQPGRHGQRPVAPEGLGPGELGDLAQHGALVHRDGALVGHHALGQRGRTGIPAPVAAERAGAQAG